MEVEIEFVGQAAHLAAKTDDQAKPKLAFDDVQWRSSALVIPAIGDLVGVLLRGVPEIRQFRCCGRRFDLTNPARPRVTVQMDLP